MARVAVISDTHLPRGTRALPEECVRLLRGADLILHGGDFVTATFLHELRALGPPVEAVYGNMDEPGLNALLPREHVVEAGGAVTGLAGGVFPRPSGGAGRAQVYVARPTDTLWAIAAAQYAGDTREAVWTLERRNGLHSATLVPGQRLVLP